jgi:hypothetical protein
MSGLRYPWPAVARQAADALVRLERADLVPQLRALLEEPDPRAPAVKEVNGKQAPVVREVVRINHHRNCLACHAPADRAPPDTLTAPVPVPGEPLPSLTQGYGNAMPGASVRVDVTYLRQDFSAPLPVADAPPWPQEQRFDFFVRTRVLTAEEARACREKLAQEGANVRAPYRGAVVAALYELAGQGAPWRRLFRLPALRPGAE